MLGDIFPVVSCIFLEKDLETYHPHSTKYSLGCLYGSPPNPVQWYLTFYSVLIRIQFASHPQAHRLIRERNLTCVFLWSLEKSLDFVSVWSILTVETSEKRNVYRMGHRVTKLSPHNFKCMWYVTCIKSSVVRARGGSFKRPWRQSESVSF